MELNQKVEVMLSRILTDTTYKYSKHPEGHEVIQPLNIWSNLLRCFTDNDFETIRDTHIYLNLIFSPASISTLKVPLPENAKVITFDYNYLKDLPHDERLAIILHEYGHAFHPSIKGDEGELIADDFVISHRQSLQRNIEDKPDLFDKPINHQRIERIIL